MTADFRRAQPSDVPQLKALWSAAFGDTDCEIDAFFRDRFATADVFVCEEGDRICSALYALKCSYRKREARYIYAVATDEKMRGRGLMSDLMRFALSKLESEGVLLTWLMPASERLRGFYERFGYKSADSFCTVNVEADASPKPEFCVISSEEAERLRSELLRGKSAVLWDADALEYARKFYSAEWISADGGLMLVTDGGEAVEALGIARDVAAAVCAAFCGKNTVRLRLPFWNGGTPTKIMLRSCEANTPGAVYASLELN